MNMQLIFTRVHFVDLLSSYPLGRSFESPGDEVTILLEATEYLEMEDLEFPVLFDKSVGGNTIKVKRGPEDGREHACGLGRS